MASDRSTVAVAQPSAPALALESEASFDERWAAWQAKGDASDRAFRRKLTVAAPLAVVVAIIVFALLR